MGYRGFVNPLTSNFRVEPGEFLLKDGSLVRIKDACIWRIMSGLRIRMILLILYAVLLLSPTAYSKSAITNISAKNPTIALYDPFIVNATVKCSYKDPYNPDEIELNAHFIDPDGREIIMPGFFLGKRGKAEVRYTPVKKGEYSYYLEVKHRGVLQVSDFFSFKVKNSRNDGFVRKSRNNDRYLVFDSGKSFFGLGHNVCWTDGNSELLFDRYFSKLNKNGCNISRVWLNNEWTLKVEFHQLGEYDLNGSKILDRVLESAKKNGIYVILVFDSYSSLMAERGGWDEEAWAKNVYNKRQGGPCEKPWDFFTDPEARKLYKKRLRYTVSRWGYSPNILAFEFWNELDAPKEWIKEMADYILSINPHGQLITTSLGYPWANNFDESTIWSLKEIDLVQRHLYGNMDKDIIGYFISTNRALIEKFGKPVGIEEFGVDGGKNDDKCDPKGEGVTLHNGIWAAALSGSYSGTMGWWWDTYMHKHDLYFHYRSLRAFIEGVNWNSKNVMFAKTSLLMRKIPKGEKITYSDVTVFGKEVWGDTTYSEFTLEKNGDLAGGVLNRYLQGSLRKKLRVEPVIHVDYPVDGKFRVYVGIVSRGARLTVTIDDKEVFSKDFKAGPGKGPWQNSCMREGVENGKKIKIYQCYYGTIEEIDVPQGKHTIKISNTGKDWLGVKRIVFTNYKGSDVVNARVAGLVVGEDMLFWIQNKAYNWYDVTVKKEESMLIKNTHFDLSRIEDGGYEIQWWDTFKGEVVLSRKAEAVNGQMIVNVPDFAKDIACKIRKQVNRTGS